MHTVAFPTIPLVHSPVGATLPFLGNSRPRKCASSGQEKGRDGKEDFTKLQVCLPMSECLQPPWESRGSQRTDAHPASLGMDAHPPRMWQPQELLVKVSDLSSSVPGILGCSLHALAVTSCLVPVVPVVGDVLVTTASGRQGSAVCGNGEGSRPS